MSSGMNNAADLMVLETSLAAFERGEINVERLCATWRQGVAGVTGLPPRYMSVLEDLLGRLESSALFVEESCSFSVEDVRASLRVWLEKASQVVDR